MLLLLEDRKTVQFLSVEKVSNYSISGNIILISSDLFREITTPFTTIGAA